MLLQVRGNQVSVLGQVQRPGRFPLETTNVRVSDMLAAAGGVTPTGDDVLVVSGTRDGKPFRKTIDIPGLFAGTRSEDDIVLAPGDTLYVDKAPTFYIYGEAQRPGHLQIERGMTVLQALAQGGGPTARGSQNRLRLNRTRRRRHRRADRAAPDRSDPARRRAVRARKPVLSKEVRPMSLHQFFSILRARRGTGGPDRAVHVALAAGLGLLRPANYTARAPVLVDVRTDPVGIDADCKPW